MPDKIKELEAKLAELTASVKTLETTVKAKDKQIEELKKGNSVDTGKAYPKLSKYAVREDSEKWAKPGMSKDFVIPSDTTRGFILVNSSDLTDAHLEAFENKELNKEGWLLPQMFEKKEGDKR